eukprot:g2599.t1
MPPVTGAEAAVVAEEEVGAGAGARTADAHSSCAPLLFDLATALVFNAIDGTAGYQLYCALANDGDTEAMVAVGVCLVEELAGGAAAGEEEPPAAGSDTHGLALLGGGGGKSRAAQGVRWLERAAAAGSAQGCYELGSLAYSGLGGVVPEDEARAFQLFERAAAQRHAGAMFMVADCLLDGTGCERDAPRAVGLLHGAAQQGHRYARQRLRELLDEDARAGE